MDTLYKQPRLGIGVIRLLDGAYVPNDTQNPDWQAYLAYQAVGGVTFPADPPAPPSQEELDTATAKAYVKLNTLKGMTPDQVRAWVDANVVDLASARDAIKTLAIAVGILARRL